MNYSFNNLHPKTQFFVSVFFVIFCVAALAWFALFFLLDRIQSESAEIEAAKIRRVSFEARRTDAKHQEAAFEALQTDIGRVDGIFVEHPLAFFEFLEDLAARNSGSISLALEGQTAGGAETPERLRVTVDGSHRNLSRFVRGIESSPYAADIRAITLRMLNQRSEFSDSLIRLSIDLKLISK